ncbi:hypothetical protein SteCoe_12870 [Stentor coeruleus]|uniref:Aldehyde dehydrogenase domain-containing protein n=1 Tax=Stentor coeruleus TaxID=5963 RepID=A0A1R2C9R6_9CILI|nr:hypothetical protein SteCoe_12870 [Stentor coeruleus]
MLARRFFSIKLETKILINNKWVDSLSGKTFPTINPATEEVIAHVQKGSAEDVDLAVNAARAAFDFGPWRRFTASQRAGCIRRLADLIEENKSELAYIETINNGKPISDSLNFDLPMTLDTYRYYAGYTDKVFGKTIPMSGPFFTYTKLEPVGVVGQIIPWNVPLIMQAWKLAPAMAAGCTVVLKPAEQTPLSALKVGELIIQAGFPPGVINIVPGFGDTGAALATHKKVDKIAFTGSTEVGLEIVKNAGVNGLRRVSLELGGKSPNIIFDDADLDLAISQAHIGVFLNQGQVCFSGSRVFVQAGIYDEFVSRSASLIKCRKLGDPLDPTTQHGSQISKVQLEKILYYIETGKSQGAKLIAGGKRLGLKGCFVEPTIFADVTDDMTIAKEEIFGPVMSILKFHTIDEVIQRANNTNYGLGAGVVTRDIEKAFKVTNALRAGTVFVNCYSVITEGAPFGGFKQSGNDKEMGTEGFMSYIEKKTVVIKTSEDTLP